MNRQNPIECCLPFPGAYEDCPFDKIADDNATAVMRHNGRLYLNLKYDPSEADFLRQVFKTEIPAYRQNKQHRNTIIGGDVAGEETERQIMNSFDLTRPKVRRQKSV